MHFPTQVKDYSRKRWLILSLLSVEIDMMITWLTPLDLADREMTVLQVIQTEKEIQLKYKKKYRRKYG